MLKFKWTSEKTINFLVSKKKTIKLRRGFAKQLNMFEKYLVEERGQKLSNVFEVNVNKNLDQTTANMELLMINTYFNSVTKYPHGMVGINNNTYQGLMISGNNNFVNNMNSNGGNMNNNGGKGKKGIKWTSEVRRFIPKKKQVTQKILNNLEKAEEKKRSISKGQLKGYSSNLREKPITNNNTNNNFNNGNNNISNKQNGALISNDIDNGKINQEKKDKRKLSYGNNDNKEKEANKKGVIINDKPTTIANLNTKDEIRNEINPEIKRDLIDKELNKNAATDFNHNFTDNTNNKEVQIQADITTTDTVPKQTNTIIPPSITTPKDNAIENDISFTTPVNSNKIMDQNQLKLDFPNTNTDKEVSIRTDKVVINSNQTINMTQNLEATPISTKRENDDFDTSSKENELNSKFKKSVNKKLNIVVLGPKQNYNIGGSTNNKDNARTTPRLLNEKKPSTSEKLEMKNKRTKNDSPYEKNKVFQIGTFSHKLDQKDSSNDTSFELNYQLNMKKPIKAYDSPEFFKKVEKQGNKMALQNHPNNKANKFKIAPYNTAMNRIVNLNTQNTQSLSQPKDAPHSSYYPYTNNINYKGNKVIKQGSPMTHQNFNNQMVSSWNNASGQNNRTRIIENESNKSNPIPAKRIYFKTDTNFIKKGHGQQMMNQHHINSNNTNTGVYNYMSYKDKDKGMGVTGNGYKNSNINANNGNNENDEFRPKTSVTRARMDSQDEKQKKKRPNSVKIMKINDNQSDLQLHSAYITGGNMNMNNMKNGFVQSNSKGVKAKVVSYNNTEQSRMNKYRDFMKKQKEPRR